MTTYLVVKDLGIIGRAKTPLDARRIAVANCNDTQDIVHVRDDKDKEIGFVVMSLTMEDGLHKITYKYRTVAKRRWNEITTDGRLKTEKKEKEKRKFKLPFGL